MGAGCRARVQGRREWQRVNMSQGARSTPGKARLPNGGEAMREGGRGEASAAGSGAAALNQRGSTAAGRKERPPPSALMAYLFRSDEPAEYYISYKSETLGNVHKTRGFLQGPY